MYQRTRQTIDVIDSEDEELQMALDASIADIQPPNRYNGDITGNTTLVVLYYLLYHQCVTFMKND